MEDIRDSFKQDTENPGECTGMKHDGKEESVHQDLEERENTMDTDDGTNRIGQMSKLLLFGKVHFLECLRLFVLEPHSFTMIF